VKTATVSALTASGWLGMNLAHPQVDAAVKKWKCNIFFATMC